MWALCAPPPGGLPGPRTPGLIGLKEKFKIKNRENSPEVNKNDTEEIEMMAEVDRIECNWIRWRPEPEREKEMKNDDE